MKSIFLALLVCSTAFFSGCAKCKKAVCKFGFKNLVVNIKNSAGQSLMAGSAKTFISPQINVKESGDILANAVNATFQVEALAGDSVFRVFPALGYPKLYFYYSGVLRDSITLTLVNNSPEDPECCPNYTTLTSTKVNNNAPVNYTANSIVTLIR